MIISCAWHKKNTGKVGFIGQKEPRHITNITGGICHDCLGHEMIKFTWSTKIERFNEEFAKL